MLPAVRKVWYATPLFLHLCTFLTDVNLYFLCQTEARSAHLLRIDNKAHIAEFHCHACRDDQKKKDEETTEEMELEINARYWGGWVCQACQQDDRYCLRPFTDSPPHCWPSSTELALTADDLCPDSYPSSSALRLLQINEEQGQEKTEKTEKKEKKEKKAWYRAKQVEFHLNRVYGDKNYVAWAEQTLTEVESKLHVNMENRSAQLTYENVKQKLQQGGGILISSAASSSPKHQPPHPISRNRLFLKAYQKRIQQGNK